VFAIEDRKLANLTISECGVGTEASKERTAKFVTISGAVPLTVSIAVQVVVE
jgi:hypothetical protein